MEFKTSPLAYIKFETKLEKYRQPRSDKLTEHTNDIIYKPVDIVYFYWEGLQAHTTQAKLYRAVKTKLQGSGMTTKGLSKDLKKSAKSINSWTRNQFPHAIPRTQDLCPYAQLRTLRIRSCYPVLLRLQQKHTAEKAALDWTARQLLSWIVRNVSISGKGDRSVRAMLPEIEDCIDNWTGFDTYKSAILEVLKGRDVTGEELQQHLQTRLFEAALIPKYLLGRLWWEEENSSSSHLPWGQMHLEHILPQQPDSTDWAQFHSPMTGRS